MKAKITISKQNRVSDEVIEISIKDKNSGIVITEVTMSLEEFTRCLTGLANCECNIQSVMSPEKAKFVGKTKIIKTVEVSSPISYNKEERKVQVALEVSNLPEVVSGEYKLLDDGVNIQQPNNKHNVTLYKYE